MHLALQKHGFTFDLHGLSKHMENTKGDAARSCRPRQHRPTLAFAGSSSPQRQPGPSLAGAAVSITSKRPLAYFPNVNSFTVTVFFPPLSSTVPLTVPGVGVVQIAPWCFLSEAVSK